MKTREQDLQIMNLLKVKEISRIICDTDMGTLKLRIRKGETAYKFILDAVELPKELNNELMEAIYPTPLEKAMQGKEMLQEAIDEQIKNSFVEPIAQVITKPRGRPKGSKGINKLTK